MENIELLLTRFYHKVIYESKLMEPVLEMKI